MQGRTRYAADVCGKCRKAVAQVNVTTRWRKKGEVSEGCDRVFGGGVSFWWFGLGQGKDSNGPRPHNLNAQASQDSPLGGTFALY